MNEYAERDLGELDDHYYRHVNAMTGEKLHSKSAIAAELAWRDKRIAELEADRQAAIDGVLRDVANAIMLQVTTRGYDPDDPATVYQGTDMVEVKAGMADRCYHIVLDRIGTNPSARNKDADNAELRADAERWRLARFNIDPKHFGAVGDESDEDRFARVDRFTRVVDAALRQRAEQEVDGD